MSPTATALLCVLAALAGGALGSYCLGSVLVMGGASAQWLEAHRWVYAAGGAVGVAVAAASLVVGLWLLAVLGAALALAATSRYFWLNV